MALSYAHGASETPLLGETIGDNLARTATAHPDADALVSCHQDVRWSYAELDERVDRAAAALIAAGLEPGDRVGLWSPNRAEWTLVQYAAARAGIIQVSVNPAYRTSELEFALRQSGCRMLVAAPAFKTSDYVAMTEEVRPALPELEHAIFFDTPEWDELLEAGSAISTDQVRACAAQVAFDDPVNIQYTSGTTGFPKGATLSHHNILNNGYFVAEYCGYTPADRVCLPVPFYHCFGQVMGNLGCTSHGSCMVIPEASFEPEATLRAVQRERCTSLYGVPTMFIAELGAPDFEEYDLSSLRTGIMAGSPCPVEVMKQVIDRMHMRDVTITYGITETSPVSTQTEAGDSLEKRTQTVGRVHPHLEVKLIDPLTGKTVPRGEQGELCTRGYSVMLGYWNDPEKTAEAVDEHGWMHTGDLATMDEDGYLNIVGRSKNMVIRGGENVYPREVEEFLHTHPAVLEASVIGVPDDRYGEELMAWIRVRDGHTLTEDQVRDYCKDRIAHFKRQRYVKFADEFPMTVTGKVQKYKLREQAIEELGLHERATA